MVHRSGKPVWGDTWLGLPADRPGRRCENLLTGEIVEAVQWEGRPTLPAASVFTCFPVAFLIQERETRR
jgi:maltooligosyltrehalose synthase